MQLTWITAPPAAQHRLAGRVLARLKEQGAELTRKLENPSVEAVVELLRQSTLFHPQQAMTLTYTDVPQLSEAFFDAVGQDDGWHVVVLCAKEPAKKHLPDWFWKRVHRVVEPAVPYWPGKRISWVRDFASSLGGVFDREAAALLVDWVSDDEELRCKVELCVALADGKRVNSDLVRGLAVDEGSRDQLKVLDALAAGDMVMLTAAFTGNRLEVIPLLAAVQNRLRAAWYTALFGSQAKELLGLTDYQTKTAAASARRYKAANLALALGEVCRLSLAERRGEGEGLPGLQVCLFGLMSAS